MNDFETPYCAYATFRGRTDDGRIPEADRAAAAAAAEEALAVDGVVVRGAYSTTGFRAEADLMLWLVGPDVDGLQDALVRFRQSPLGRGLEPFWNAVGVHRDAEFNRAHVPAFLQGEEPRKYLSVYPFVRSLEWYVLEPEERREMLAEHGKMARPYPDVRANTVSSFSLGDYEWLLAFEADDPTRIVDLMRDLRGARARLHMREELPFHFGIRKPLADVAADLP